MRQNSQRASINGVLDGDEIRAWIYEATTNELEDFLRDASLGEYQIPQEFLKMREPHCNYAWQGLRLNRIGQLFPNFW